MAAQFFTFEQSNVLSVLRRLLERYRPPHVVR